jgi:hypothetical protein
MHSRYLVRRRQLTSSPGCVSLRRMTAATTGGDPLAAISFLLRLQTHNGDNVPLGLYQDVSCTIPATVDGDPIAAWRDETPGGGGLLLVQGAIELQGILVFVNGTPTIYPDGIDDMMARSGPLSLSAAVMVVGAEAPSVHDCALVTTRYNDSYWAFGGVGYFGTFRNTRLEGYPSVVPVTGYHTHTIKSGASYEVRIDGVSQGVQSGDFDTGNKFEVFKRGNGTIFYDRPIVSIFVAQTLTDAEITLTENYSASLNPT